jgi:hypothetical protein
MKNTSTPRLDSRRGSVTVALTASFGLWWLLWLAAWLSRLENPAFALLAPILPVYYGVGFLTRQDLDMAFASLGISALTLIFVAASLRHASKALFTGAHVFVCLYWLWSFALVSMGV